MAFAILRTSKLKSFGEIGSSLSHNYRTRDTPNADPTRTHKNEHEIKSAYSVMEAIKRRLPEKLRKNAVLCIEYMITASPEWSAWGKEGEKEFFDKSLEFLKEKHGAENVITTSIHRDETTPHLIAYVVPVDEKGKLNARHFLGGRQKLSQIQTDFAKKIEHLGLQRGLEGSRAEHTTIKKYYAEIQAPTPTPILNKGEILSINTRIDHPAPELFEGKEKYVNRVLNGVYKNINQQLNAFYGGVQANFSDVQTNYENKLTAERLRADKYEKAHGKAVKENQKLRKRYENFKQYKELYPDAYEQLEKSIAQEIEYHHKLIKEEKLKAEREAARHEYEAYEAARKKQRELENIEKEFKNNISNAREKRLEAHNSDFNRRISECTDQAERNALTQIYSERKANSEASPVQVMNELLKDKSQNYYFGLCIDLFKTNNSNDFKYALERCNKFLKITSEEGYQDGLGFIDSPITRQVCAASLNQLDNLLMRYGSSYADQANVLREHLSNLEKIAEQDWFKYVLDDKRTEENSKRMSELNHQIPSPVPAPKKKRDDLDLSM